MVKLSAESEEEDVEANMEARKKTVVSEGEAQNSVNQHESLEPEGETDKNQHNVGGQTSSGGASNSIGPDPLGGFKYLKRQASTMSKAPVFVPEWEFQIDNVGQDLSSVKDFCIHGMPPSVKERLSKMPTGESICRGWKANFDQFMYRTDQLLRLEQLLHINKEFAKMLEERKARINELENENGAVQLEKNKVNELTERLSSVEEKYRQAQEEDQQKMGQLEQRVCEAEQARVKAEDRVRELEQAMQVACAERNDAVMAKRSLQAGLAVIAKNILKCPGITGPFLELLKAVKEQSAHLVAMEAQKLMGVLPTELDKFLSFEAAAKVSACRQALKEASSPYVQKLVDNLDLSVEQLLALEP